jgi:hypothetical protein
LIFETMEYRSLSFLSIGKVTIQGSLTITDDY